MITFPLSEVEESFKPDDLVPITIQKVKNPVTNNFVDKYIIHVNGDSFGLFSGRYVYCSTKGLVDKLKNYNLVNKTYSNGFLTVYLEHKEQAKVFELNESELKALLLLRPELENLNKEVTSGIFITNSYTGTSKLSIGNYIKISGNEDVFVKYYVANQKTIHISSITSTVENLEAFEISIEDVKKIDPVYFESLLPLSKKKLEELKAHARNVMPYNTLHLLIILSQIAPNSMEEIGKIVSKFLNKD